MAIDQDVAKPGSLGDKGFPGRIWYTDIPAPTMINTKTPMKADLIFDSFSERIVPTTAGTSLVQAVVGSRSQIVNVIFRDAV